MTLIELEFIGRLLKIIADGDRDDVAHAAVMINGTCDELRGLIPFGATEPDVGQEVIRDLLP